ncbi:hypothetical protein GPN2_20299 [Streptomyces murinus]
MPGRFPPSRHRHVRASDGLIWPYFPPGLKVLRRFS